MSHRGPYWLALAAWVVCLTAMRSPAAAVSLVSKGVHVEALPVKGEAHHGYVPHRFEVRNSSSKKRTVTLTMPEDPAEEGKFAIRSIQRTVTVAPGTAMKVLLLQPPLPMGLSANELRVKVEGQSKTLKAAFQPRHDDAMNLGYQAPQNVLLSRALDLKEFEDEANRMAGISSGFGPSHGIPDEFVTFEQAATDLRGWDTHWLAYSLFDAIVMQGSEWQSAPPDVQSALRRWVKCGGELYVIGEGFTPSTNWPVAQLTRRTHDGTEYLVGFGCVFEFDTAADIPRDFMLGRMEDLWRNDRTIPMLSTLREGMEQMHDTEEHYHHGPWSNPRDNEDFNQYFEVVDPSRVPVRLVVGLLTLFVILAGPVSLFILSRKGKRIWFLWTLPALSFSISGLVFVVSWLSEGITPRLRMDAVTVLDQSTQEAATLGGVGLYAPVAPGALNFSGATEVTPLFEPQVSDPGSDRRVVWGAGGGQRLEGNWVGSRVPTHFAVRKAEHREERLEVKWTSSGAPEIVNGLGAHITQLHLCREDGAVFSAQNITAGAKATLSRVSTAGIATGDFEQLPKLISKALDQPNRLDPSEPDPPKPTYLVPGTYWATLAGSPFLENPLGQRTVEQQLNCHVIGILPREEAGP